MALNEAPIPARFELKWLVGPLLIILAAIALVLFFPSVSLAPAPTTTEQPELFTPAVDVQAAKALALTQCATTFDCTQSDCLEKVLTHVDSATQTIHAVLRTPAPREFRDHLRAAIKRGVTVQLVLDSSLNPAFYLQGASIRVKRVSQFVATNFMIIDGQVAVYGSDPLVYAASPDVIRVACTDPERGPYLSLFDRVWADETTPYTPSNTREEVLSDSQLLIPPNGPTCQESQCAPDSFTCEGTTKIFQNYYCSSVCMYEIIPLYFSTDCGYTTPGFGPDGNPLVVITEADVDGGTLANEFVEFTALQPLELTGFTLEKDGTPLITFAEPFILNGAARVYSGSGESSTTIVYLNQSAQVWNAHGATATLKNPQGVVVATRTFE